MPISKIWQPQAQAARDPDVQTANNIMTHGSAILAYRLLGKGMVFSNSENGLPASDRLAGAIGKRP
jgi:hypothetical protein